MLVDPFAYLIHAVFGGGMIAFLCTPWLAIDAVVWTYSHPQYRWHSALCAVAALVPWVTIVGFVLFSTRTPEEIAQDAAFSSGILELFVALVATSWLAVICRITLHYRIKQDFRAESSTDHADLTE